MRISKCALEEFETGWLTMMTLQKIIRPTMLMAGELEDKACARVTTMMIMSSRPYMDLRPTTSERMPKLTWPMMTPAKVAAFMAVSDSAGKVPPK